MKKLLLFILFPFLTFGQVQIGQDIDGEAAGDRSGIRVELSANGNILAIGAFNNSENGDAPGHVRVFENQNGNWAQIGQDIDGEAELDFSGRDISLSADGTIIAIGAIGNDGNENGFDIGHVRVFENQNGIWTQIGQDIDGEEDFSGFGVSVSLSSDGTIVSIGAENYNNTGRVRVFENVNNNWIQIGQNIDGEAPGNNSGFSSDISSDGSIVAIGAPQNDGNGPFSGHVRVFENQNGVWTQVGQDIDGEAVNDRAGSAVRLSSNGNMVAVGAPGNNNNIGHVRVFENVNNNWIQIGQNINGENEDDISGARLSLSSDGTIIAITAIFNGDNGINAGHVRIYENQNGNWTQIGQDIDGEDEGDTFGRSVSLSSNGAIVAIGGDFNDDNGNNSGHVRVFDLSDLLATEAFTSSTFSLYPNPASTQITIEVPQENDLEKVTIYNNLGQLVISSKTTTIDTSTLSKGVYIVEVKTSQGTSSKKLIVE